MLIGVAFEAYADFVTTVKSIARVSAILYHVRSSGVFNVWAILDGGICVSLSANSAPTNFASDFPGAVVLTADLMISG